MEIGGIGNSGITPLSGANFQRINKAEMEITPLVSNDGFKPGVFTGPEIKDPRLAFKEPEIKSPLTEIGAKPEVELTTPWEMGVFNKPEVVPKNDIMAYEGFYLSEMQREPDQFNGFFLNGPSSMSKGIMTLSGETVNNPKFLTME